jgi:hypothetical protein
VLDGMAAAAAAASVADARPSADDVAEAIVMEQLRADNLIPLEGSEAETGLAAPGVIRTPLLGARLRDSQHNMYLTDR